MIPKRSQGRLLTILANCFIFILLVLPQHLQAQVSDIPAKTENNTDSVAGNSPKNGLDTKNNTPVESGKNKIDPETEDWLKPKTGHFISASLGYGFIESNFLNVCYELGSLNGMEWDINYAWLSKRVYSASFFGNCTIGAGGIYSGFNHPFKSKFSHDNREWTASQNITLNYLAPQFIINLLSRSKKWTFSFQTGIGLGISCFHGSMIAGEPSPANRNFSTTKVAVAYNGRIQASYNISKRLSIHLALASVAFYNRHIFDNPNFTHYQDALIETPITLGALELGFRFQL